MDKTSAVSLHEQLDTIMRSDLKNHRWEPDQKIPSENELAQMYGLSRMTVRGVINNLVNDGLLYRVQGKGTFVSPIKLDVDTAGIQSFREQIEDKGYQFYTDIISCETIKTTAYLKETLKLHDNISELLYVYRLTYIEDDPTCIHKAFILPDAAKFVTKENLEKMSLFSLLKYCGYSTNSIMETIKTDFPTESDCKLLKIGKWHPLLIVSDIHETSSGNPFILNEYAFRGEKVNINVEVGNKRSFLLVND